MTRSGDDKETSVRCIHILDIYKSTWTDMFIERTYMRLGHGAAATGAIGVATGYHHMGILMIS